MAVSSATYLVAASCILHNICELRRDDFLENWLDEVQASVHQPEHITLTGENDEAESDAAMYEYNNNVSRCHYHHHDNNRDMV